jgi:pimeloyl-ACP methyl ester carboxylesterase
MMVSTVKSQASSLQVNGYTFDYQANGVGDPVVLVHGSASDRRTWTSQLEYFSREHRALAYSRRYHWPNTPIASGEDYAMRDHVDDAQAIIESLTEEPVHLVGHSYGAFISLLLALRKPGLVRSLTLAEPPAITLFVSNQPTPMELARLFVSRPRTALAIVKFGVKGVAPATQAISDGDQKAALEHFGSATLGVEAFRALTFERLKQANQNFIVAELTGSGFPSLDQMAIRMLSVPTLLISASDSPPLFGYLLDRLEELIPNTDRIVISGASHIMHEDQPERFNAAVYTFMENNS